jgi:hypothetical protein
MYHLPIYSKGPSWMSPWQALVAGVLCLGLGLFSIIRGGSDKDRKMTRTHPAYTTSPSNQTPQPTFSRLVPPFPMIKILQRQPSTPLLGPAELELVR